jgi:mono/diheme cytochrome c family protein
MPFPTPRLSLFLGLCTTVAAVRVTPAQAVRSTKDRVYSAVQALQGRDVYLGRCQSCHTAISHTGAPFRANWDKRPLSELYDYMMEKMPKDSPGTLSTDEYTKVLAYILRMNGMPAGADDLPSEKSALKAIRIDAPVPKTPSY